MSTPTLMKVLARTPDKTLTTGSPSAHAGPKSVDPEQGKHGGAANPGNGKTRDTSAHPLGVPHRRTLGGFRARRQGGGGIFVVPDEWLSARCVIVCRMPNGRNADPAVVAAKMARIREPHVKPLNDLADRIAESMGLPHGHVPYVDPDQGGIDARVLVLLDNPSTKAEAGTGSGLLSLDNDDRTARNCREAYARHGVPWSQVVHWNVVPFPVAGSETVVRPPPNAPGRCGGPGRSSSCARTSSRCCCSAQRPATAGPAPASAATSTSCPARSRTARPAD